MSKTILLPITLFALSIGLVSCGKGGKSEYSSATGWKYNDEKWGGFEKSQVEGQIAGPNLVLIEGGTFTMGQTDQDVMSRWDAIPRRVTVSSFYIDETEVTNINYREFMYWNSKVFGGSNPERLEDIRPDTTIWRQELAYNEPLVENYFSHPSYDDYPVVGVSWEQAQEYCLWRTDRVNEMLLIKKGIFNPNPEQSGSDNFNTEAYLSGMYEGNVKKNLKDKATGGERSVRYSDGIMLPSYRLPTEAEWEYAALGLQGKLSSSDDELIAERRVYPWDGSTPRYMDKGKDQGKYLANFKLGYGNYMGVAGNLNDNAAGPAQVGTFVPNDYGLYNMAGNVSEWTQDVYRPLTSFDLRDADNEDLNPFRGNVFTTNVTDEEGRSVGVDSLGRIRKRMYTEEEVAKMDNVSAPDSRNFLDGDEDSGADYYGENSLLSDKTRVVKGGSWADRAYWLSPGTRRFLDQDKASRTVGFRCAMIRTGAPSGNDGPHGNEFSTKKKNKKKRFK